MKHQIRTTIMVITLFALFFTFATANASTIKYVTADGVRVRDSTQGGNIIGKLYYGDKVEVIQYQGSWCQIRYGNSFGYVIGYYLNDSTSSKSSVQTVALVNDTITLYNKSVEPIATIPKNSVVKVIDKNNRIAKVVYNSMSGYIWNNNLTFKSTSMKILGCYSVSYSSNGQARKNNISKAVSKLHKTVLYSGESCSLLSVFGSGYEVANEYEGAGAYVGGGISQVATTLKRAINDAQNNGSNIIIREETTASEKTPYAKKKQDAIVTPSQDFVFQNNTNHSIRIYAFYFGDTVSVIICQ